MIELFKVSEGKLNQIPTESIVWSGGRTVAARKIDARILYRKDAGRNIVKVNQGDTVLFRWKGKELFRGIIFSDSLNKSGILTFTAYDLMQYFLRNKDVNVFINMKANQIANRIMQDFQIPIGNLVDTGYAFKTLTFDNETTLYDMIMKALEDTQKQTRKKYQILSDKGKVNLIEVTEPTLQWVLETGVNIEDFNYTRSIEETATRVKLVAGEEKEQITAVVTDAQGQKRFGVLQHFEKVTEDINQGQLTQRANSILAEKKGVKKKLEIQAVGISDLTSGMPIQVIEKAIPVQGKYYIESDAHSFVGNNHTMSLDLVEKID